MSKIQGVIFKNIKSHKDDRGFFREIFKDNKLISKKFKQISHSFIKKNIIKAWHLHRKQSQWNYLLKGKIILYLYDTRNKSKTFKKHTTICIDSKKKSVMYFFPAGVAHGYITLSKENHMIYATSGLYDPDEEYKISLENNLIPNFFNKF
ncbi:dTDP-4-dehydrorhamnose 3,5-epimerase family protein [Candidatus Pelagibacter sp.]|uniref:dTDP-4-dehydrorhamnose 3,5-epimerase family protein n=1 Tax=Candidatus Pelagibacter sp. TaxID=2024849 RepID=UPI003F84F9C0